MALPNVAEGDPHVAAHNDERSAINDLQSKFTLYDAKGKLLLGSSTPGSPVALPVGSNGTQLFADSSQAGGLRYGYSGELPKSQFVSSVDLNTISSPGLYFIAGGANRPSVSTGFLTVTGVDSVRRQAYQDVSGRLFSRHSLNAGSTWSSWVEVRTSAPYAGNTIVGTGSPEGVVTAPVGTEYVDAGKTNGALKWIKNAESGNTGWVPTQADTGMRAISTWDTAGNVTGEALNSGSWTPTPGIAGGIWVQRINQMIYLYVQALRRLSTSNATVWSSYVLPAGMRPFRNICIPYVNENGRATLLITSIGGLQRGSGALAGNDGDVIYANGLGPANASPAWPTVLPGTAA